jgi:hypothetical protein
VCVGLNDDEGLNSLLRDPLIRLVMQSDGVTEQAMIAVVDQLRRSMAARAPRDSRQPPTVRPTVAAAGGSAILYQRG